MENLGLVKVEIEIRENALRKGHYVAQVRSGLNRWAAVGRIERQGVEPAFRALLIRLLGKMEDALEEPGGE